MFCLFLISKYGSQQIEMERCKPFSSDSKMTLLLLKTEVK